MSTDDKGISDITQDRITKVPDGLDRGSGKKEKDPKKVAAGKALAEKNKRAREALRREEERETANAAEKEQGESEGDGSSWTPEISFSNVLTLIGIGLTIVSFYREYKRPAQGSGLPPRGANHSQMPSGLCQATEPKTEVRKSPKNIGME